MAISLIHKLKGGIKGSRISFHITMEYLEDWLFLVIELPKGSLKKMKYLVTHVQIHCQKKKEPPRVNKRFAIINKGYWNKFGQIPSS